MDYTKTLDAKMFNATALNIELRKLLDDYFKHPETLVELYRIAEEKPRAAKELLDILKDYPVYRQDPSLKKLYEVLKENKRQKELIRRP